MPHCPGEWALQRQVYERQPFARRLLTGGETIWALHRSAEEEA